MATAKLEKVERDFLTCAICLEHYTDPITLDCQHSFCRQCISDYIKTRAEAREKKLIPCPCCSQMSRVPDPTRPVEGWAGQLKPGFVIQGLVDTLTTEEVQKEETPTTSCTICHQLGDITPGVLWCPECEAILCDRCVKMHRVQATTRDHNLLKPGEKGKTKKKRKLMCKEHQEEQIKFYCQDCDKALCHSCSVVYHRKCESVVTIKSMMSKFKTDIAEHRRNLLEKEDMEGKFTKAKQAASTQLQKDKTSIQEEIRKASKTVIEHIKQKEKQLMDQLNAVTDTRVIQLQADIKKGDIEKKTYRQYGEYIDQALTSDNEMDIYDLFQTWKTGGLDIAQESGRKLGEKQVSLVKFKIDNKNIDSILDDFNLGEIICNICDPMLTPVLYSTTDARTESDEKVPFLRDVTVLVVNDVKTTVVTDESNKCVKSFYTKHGQACHGRLPLDDSPYCITKFKENKVMVAVKYSNQIVTIEVIPDLRLVSTINTSEEYESLAVLDHTTLAAGRDSDYVDILNMEGQVMKSVSEHNNKTLFKYPDYMCVNKTGNLLVSDYNKKSVTCLTSEGNVVWIYPTTSHNKLDYLRGITTTSEGDILVADGDTKGLIQLSESGQYVRDILTVTDDLSFPTGICVDNHGSLFVCDGGNIKEFIFT